MAELISRRGALAAGLGGFVAPSSAADGPPTTKIGIIGLGKRARKHIVALKRLKQAKVAALCDLESARISEANGSLGGQATPYTDYRELIADEDVGVVVIATPNYLHAEMALAAIRAGKDVLVEKPIGIRYEEAKKVEEEARRHGSIVAVGMQRRYMSGDERVLEIATSGRLGQIRFISQNEFIGDWSSETWRYTDPKTVEKVPWRNRRELAGTTMLEFSVHSFAFVQSMLGSSFKRVSATGGAVKHSERTMRDVVALIVDYENGARLQHSHCSFARRASWQLTIVGDQGYLQWDRSELKLQEQGQSRPKKVDLPALRRRENPEVEMYEEFLKNVGNRTPSPLGPSFAIEATKIAYAADRSILENRIVRGEEFG